MNSFVRFVLLITVSIVLVNSLPNINKKNKNAPVLLISLDGFRASKLNDFLDKNPESALKKYFVDAGVKADYMTPTFPSLTFPNHFSIVTGLNNENHGIVGNTIYDPSYNKKVSLIGGNNSLEVQWWNRSEPIWLTAKNQGFKTSSFFWVGSEVWTRNPDVFLSYKETYSFKSRCDEVVNWFKKLEMDFVTLYFNEPDHTGHEFGPNSTEYNNKIVEMDQIIGYLINELEEENLLDNLNIIIVSDHGMAEMVGSNQNGTQIISNYVDVNLIDATKTIYGIVANIYPKNESVTDDLFNALTKIPNLKVFYKNETPESFYYSKSDRIAPIVTASDEGYVLNTQKQTLKGNHGFNNSIESMQAIFLARGPGFLPNKRLNGFRNVNVYPLLCDLLKMNCNPHNGTIDTFAGVLADPIFTTFSVISTNTASNNHSNQNKIYKLNLLFSFLLSLILVKF